MIFTFAAICNKLFKLKCLREFRSICICSFVTTNQGQNCTVYALKMEISNFITNCVELVFRRFSMIFTFAVIYNKLSKLKLLQEFRSLHISIFVTTNQSSSVLILVETKIQVHTLWNFWGSLSLKSLLQIAVNAKIIENRQKRSQRNL